MKALLISKKFIAAIVGVIVGLAARVGLDLDQASVLLIVSPLMAYILGQGIADHGKERAKIIVNNITQGLDDATDDAIDQELRP